MVAVEWVATGVVILIAAATASWRFAGFRGDMSDRWGERVYLARAGLSEQAAQVLRSLQRELADLLGVEEAFDPLTVVADPASIKSQVGRFLKLIKVRDRVVARYRWLLRIGPILLVTAIAFAIGIVMTLGHLAELFNPGWVAVTGWVFLGASGLAGIAGFVAYAYLQHYLSVAETLSRPEA